MAQDLRVSFRIPPQPMDQAVLELSRQANMSLVAVGDIDPRMRSPEISGRMSVATALHRLLERTGLDFQIGQQRLITITPRHAGSSLPDSVVPGTPVSQPVTLPNVVVSARRRDERWIDVPIAVSSVTARQIEAHGMLSAADAVSTMPSVAVVDNGAAFTQVQIRGVSSSLGGNDNGYYLDDVPFTGLTVPWHPDTRLYDVDRVEVLKGPQGTLFGEGSLGGTIRVVTKAPELDEFAASSLIGLASTDGDAPGQSHHAMVNAPLVDRVLALRAVASREIQPGWTRPSNPDAATNDQDIAMSRVRLRWSPDERWTADAGWTSTRTRAPAGDFESRDGLVTDRQYMSNTAWHSRSFNIQYRFDRSSLTLLHSSTQLHNALRGDIALKTSGEGTITIRSRNWEARWNSLAGQNVDWIAGVAQRTALRDDNLLFNDVPVESRGSSRSNAVFGELTFRGASLPLSLTVGVRHVVEDVENQDHVIADDVGALKRYRKWVPRANVGWHRDDRTLVYASVAQGFRSGIPQPSVSNQRAMELGVDVPAILRPDTMVTYEAGFKRLSEDARFQFNGAVFSSRWKDLPVRLRLDDLLNAVVNSRGARMRGVEFETRILPTESLDLQFNASYIDSHLVTGGAGGRREEGIPLYNVSRWGFSALGSYTKPIGIGVLSASAALRINSARQTGMFDDGTPGDAITALNLRLGWQVDHIGASVFINNVANEQGAVTSRDAVGTAVRIRPRTVGVELAVTY
ncbi:TonB-dependent receptor [Stenotrophomonas humi]